MGRRKLLLGLYRATPVKRPRKHRVRETPIETDRCVSAVLRGNATHVKPSWLDGRYRRRAFRTVRRLDRKRERKTSRQRSINGTRFGHTRFNRFRRNAFRARKRRRRNERFYFGRTLIGFISISRKTVPDSAPFSPSSRTYRRFLYSILHAFFFFLHFLVRLWHLRLYDTRTPLRGIVLTRTTAWCENVPREFNNVSRRSFIDYDFQNAFKPKNLILTIPVPGRGFGFDRRSVLIVVRLDACPESVSRFPISLFLAVRQARRSVWRCIERTVNKCTRGKVFRIRFEIEQFESVEEISLIFGWRTTQGPGQTLRRSRTFRPCSGPPDRALCDTRAWYPLCENHLAATRLTTLF